MARPSPLVLAALLCTVSTTLAADWPMWRCTPNHSATTTGALAGTLYLQWTRDYPQLIPAWPDQLEQGWSAPGLLYFDVAYEPVVVDTTMIVGSSYANRVTGISVVTGLERWRYHTGGPVRLAPACAGGRAYVACDDGYLYCLNVQTGALVWKFRGAPKQRSLLGNGRLTSVWPVRGGPVVARYERAPGDSADAVHFTAGIFPFEGVFLYALDAQTGSRIWLNDSTGAIWINQPHTVPAFAGIGPQGYLCAVNDRLIVPGGRSVPAGFDRTTGAMLYYQLATYGQRGLFHVTASGTEFYNGGYAYNINTGLETGTTIPDPYGTAPRIIAGGTVYRVGSTGDVKTDLSTWSSGVLPGTVRVILAAADRLFAVTREGRIYCWGATSTTPVTHSYTTTPAPGADQYTTQAAQILSASGKTAGYCLALGIGTGRLIEELARQSQLHVIALDPDSAKVERLRSHLDSAGLYGSRMSVHIGTVPAFRLSPYMADLLVSEDIAAAGIAGGRSFVAEVFRLLRPSGGVAYLPVTDYNQFATWLTQARCPYAALAQSGAYAVLSRPTAPAGADNWTHQYHDGGNSVVSNDELVKTPLGLMWFGGPTHFDVLPRHGHGPSPHVVDGRLFIEGANMVRAVDVYTGRLLWQNAATSVGQSYNNTSHESGANGIGANFVSVSDGVYVLNGTVCRRYDPATGSQLGQFTLPSGAAGTQPKWGYVVVSGDRLVAASGPLRYDAGIIGTTASQNAVASIELVAMDRYTGAVAWRKTARNAFRHNSISVGDGKVFCIDGQPYDTNNARVDTLGLAKSAAPAAILPATLMALDLATGDTVWSSGTNVFGTWTGYSAEHNVLLQATRDSRDMLTAEPSNSRVIAYNATTGAMLWDRTFGYGGPLIIHGRTIITHDGYGARDLLTGDAVTYAEPLVGTARNLTYTRNYGCNTNIASRNLVTFRSAAAGYFDLKRFGGTGNLGGFKSSCTSNLIPAGGVLNAPDYTRTCVCRYQNQTSLALVHTPDVEAWTFNSYTLPAGRILRVGVNFGAPGDRRDDNGVLWLDYPSAGSPSPAPAVSVSPAGASYFRHHAARVESGSLPWVAASGVTGVTSVSIPLGATSAQTYTVQLYFMEPEDLSAGQRVFDVAIQGQPVLSNFDIVQQAGAPNRAIMREFRNIAVSAGLTVSFTARTGQPLICGICAVDQARYADSLASIPTAMVSPIIGTVLNEGQTYWLVGEGRSLSWAYDADNDGTGEVAIDTGAAAPFVAPSGVTAPMTITLYLRGTDGTVTRTFTIRPQIVSVKMQPPAAPRLVTAPAIVRPPAAASGSVPATRTMPLSPALDPRAAEPGTGVRKLSEVDDYMGEALPQPADYRPRDMRWNSDLPGLEATALRASSWAGRNTPARTLDRDLTSRWAPAGAGNQWLVYDLGAARTVGSVTLVWFAARACQAALRVETSLDGKRFTSVDAGQLSGRGTHTTQRTFLAQEARYVRLCLEPVDGQQCPSVYEVGLHGPQAGRLSSAQAR